MAASRKPHRPRLNEIAAAARVSLATVDRVINDRGGVRPQTAARVYAVARELRYPRILPERFAPKLRLDILMQDSATPFHQALGRLFVEHGRAYQGHGVTCYRHSIGELEPRGVARRISDLAALSDGLAISVVEHPSVRQAVRAAIERGTPLVTLANDLNEPRRLAYVGIDNRTAGRAAAYLLGRFIGPRPGKVALVAGTLSYLSHEQRVAGFRSAMADRFAALEVTDVMLGYDDIDLTYARARQALEIPDLVGFYNAGAGNRGIAQALIDTGRSTDITFVGHELTDHSRRFLTAGVMDAVIDQNTRGQATRALDILLGYHGVADRRPRREPLPIDIVLPENIPPRGPLGSRSSRRQR